MGVALYMTEKNDNILGADFFHRKTWELRLLSDD